MGRDLAELLGELKEDIASYAENKFELFKLNAYERVGRVTGLLSYGLLMIILAFFVLLFLFFSLGFFLGECLESQGLGFICVAVLCILILVIVVANKKKVQAKVINEVIEALTANDDKNDDNSEKDIDPA